MCKILSIFIRIIYYLKSILASFFSYVINYIIHYMHFIQRTTTAGVVLKLIL